MKIIFFLSVLAITLVLPFSFAQEDNDIKYLQKISLEKIEEERYDEALTLLDKILETDPDNLFAYNNKGAILLKQEKYNESILILEKSLQINPNNTESWNNKGIAYSKSLDFPNALFSFYQALKIDSKNQIAYENTKKLSEVLPLVDYSEQGFGILQIWDINGTLIGSSKITSIGLLPEIGVEALKERSKIIQLDDEKEYLIFHDVQYQRINSYVGGIDISLFQDNEQIKIGEIKTHGFIARAGNVYTYDIVLFYD